MRSGSAPSWRLFLSPDGDLGVLDLADVLDTEALQAVMDDFHQVTGIGVGILNAKGRCAGGHRLAGTSAPSSTVATRRRRAIAWKVTRSWSTGVEPGEFKIYRCKNGMYDMVTPIIVGGRHLGNLFLGQFFFANEESDVEDFRRRARRYGFDESAYLDALDRVPRWTRDYGSTT